MGWLLCGLGRASELRPFIGQINREAAVVGPDGLAGIAVLQPPDVPNTPPDPQYLLTIHRWIQTMHAHCDVVPVRYGAVFTSSERLTQYLIRHQDQHQAVLERIAGCTELGVRLLLVPRALSSKQPSDPSGSGLAYLLDRKRYYGLENQQRAIHCMRAVLDATHNLVRAHQPIRSGADATFQSAVLVPKPHAERFRALASACLTGHSAIASGAITGPWAPYSFAALS